MEPLNITLDKIGASQWLCDWFINSSDEFSDRDTIKLTKKCVDLMCAEYHIDFVQRKFLGYYKVDKTKLTIKGLHPLTLKELLVWGLYASQLVFHRTTLDMSLAFLNIQFQFYGVDMVVWKKIVEDFKDESVRYITQESS